MLNLSITKFWTLARVLLLLASVRGNYLCSWLCLFVVWFTFSGFSGFIPQVPIQVLAVTGSASGASVVFHSNVAASLLADGTNLASKLFAKFQTTSSQFQHQGKFRTLLHLLRRVTEWGLAGSTNSRFQDSTGRPSSSHGSQGTGKPFANLLASLSPW